jgi:hypothetical protein
MPKVKVLSEAHAWLDKAVQYEVQGKAPKLVEMAFVQAVNFELAAFDGRQ